MNLDNVTRVEIIDHTQKFPDGGRVYLRKEENMRVELSLQDDLKTLKVFLLPKYKEEDVIVNSRGREETIEMFNRFITH